MHMKRAICSHYVHMSTKCVITQQKIKQTGCDARQTLSLTFVLLRRQVVRLSKSQICVNFACLRCRSTSRRAYELQAAMFMLKRTHPRLSRLVTPTLNLLVLPPVNAAVTHHSIHRSPRSLSTHRSQCNASSIIPASVSVSEPSETSPVPAPPHVSVLLNEILDYLKPVSLKVGFRHALQHPA